MIVQICLFKHFIEAVLIDRESSFTLWLTFRTLGLRKLKGGCPSPQSAPVALTPIGGLTLSHPRPGVKGRKTIFDLICSEEKNSFAFVWRGQVYFDGDVARATLTLDAQSVGREINF